MPTYVVISNHPPNSCPSANQELRKRGRKMQEALEPLLKKHKVKPATILHLDPGHKILFVLEAPSAEAVRDVLYEGGFMQWNDFEFYMTSTLEGILGIVEKLPPVW
jgi:hypothetical protein